MSWSRVSYTATGPVDPDLNEAIGCLADVSKDFRDDVTQGKLNDRLSKKHKKHKTDMCELWVYRKSATELPVLALALDRSLKRTGSGTATQDVWYVTLGIRAGSGLDAVEIYNILKEELTISHHHDGKQFALIWHARKASAADEYDPDHSPVDAVVREMLKESPAALTMTPDPRSAATIPAAAAHAHFRKYLNDKGRVQKIRTIVFTYS